MTQPSEFVSLLDKIREEEIVTNFEAAKAQLRQLVQADPMKTEFQITAGCVSCAMAYELVDRFRREGIESVKVDAYKWFWTTYYGITVSIRRRGY